MLPCFTSKCKDVRYHCEMNHMVSARDEKNNNKEQKTVILDKCLYVKPFHHWPHHLEEAERVTQFYKRHAFKICFTYNLTTFKLFLDGVFLGSYFLACRV